MKKTGTEDFYPLLILDIDSCFCTLIIRFQNDSTCCMGYHFSRVCVKSKYFDGAIYRNILNVYITSTWKILIHLLSITVWKVFMSLLRMVLFEKQKRRFWKVVFTCIISKVLMHSLFQSLEMQQVHRDFYHSFKDSLKK